VDLRYSDMLHSTIRAPLSVEGCLADSLVESRGNSKSVSNGPPERRSIISRLQHASQQLAGLIEQLALLVGSALVAVLALIVFLEVVFRYFLHQPLHWTEEVARFALLWVGMLGTVAAARTGMHFAFRWTIIWLPATVQYVLRQCLNVVAAVFLAVLLVNSLVLVSLVSNQLSLSVGINLAIPNLAITFGIGGLLALHILEILDAICSVATHERLSAREINERRVAVELQGAPENPIPEGGVH
jgi:TRAP-type C4-dicarboxylate transport system permease small subunit